MDQLDTLKMPAPLIKICGVSTAQALDAVIAAGADYVGLNFFPPSPRFVTSGEAAAMAARSGSRIARIGVFVDANDNTIAEAVAAARLDGIQLHGSETPERAAQVKAHFALPVWKVVSVASAEDVRRAAAYGDAADFILFDAKTPKGTLPGGMGLKFDWNLLKAWRGRTDWGLAGGLTPDNIAAAMAATAAPLADTSSGVESAPGAKDTQRIADFCRAARGLV